MSDTRKIELPRAAKIAIICAAALLLAVMGFVIIRQLIGNSDIEKNHIAVYRSNGETYIDINGYKTSCNGLKTSSFVINENAQRVFFTAESSYDGELFDIYYCEISNLGDITQPKIIDYGVEGNYSVNDKGNLLYYLKYSDASESLEANVCNVSSKKITSFASNVEALYVFPSSQEVYYTKMHNSARVLYKYSGGKTAEKCRNIQSVMLYKDCAKPHIIYEADSEANPLLSELYIAYEAQEPKLISDSVVNAMFDNYKAGGNLYYFKATDQSVSWTCVIADEYRETDMGITKPERSDYRSFFGISYEYNKALNAYYDKLVRDEIRTALDAAYNDGDLLAPVFSAYAYNGEGNFELADNVNPQNVFSVSAFGAPKIIFESSQILKGNTDISALVAIAQRSDLDDVITYACDEIKSCVASKGMALSANSGGVPVEYPLNSYDKGRTLFNFSEDGTGFFAFVKDGQGERVTVFSNRLDDKSFKPIEAESIDTNVSNYIFANNGMYYLKLDAGKAYGDLFLYNNGKKSKVFNAANAFLIKGEGDDKIIVLKNYSSSDDEPVADYCTFVDGEETLIDTGVLISTFAADDNGRMAYLVMNDSGKKELRMFENGVRITVSQDVSEIITFR